MLDYGRSLQVARVPDSTRLSRITPLRLSGRAVFRGELSTHVNPILRFCRALVENAFADARRVRRDGNGRRVPTLESLEAVMWITSRTDWTAMHKIPPAEIRAEYWGSFEWCCQWLGADPDEVRARGLPQAWGGLTSCYGAGFSEGGLPSILRIWSGLPNVRGLLPARGKHDEAKRTEGPKA